MSSFSLEKREKILKRALFLDIGKTGSKIRTNHFIILYKPTNLDLCRIGITVTKKIGCAVIRNRVKRLLREFFRLKKRYLITPTDFIFIAGKRSHLLNYEEVAKELTFSFKKNKLLRVNQ